MTILVELRDLRKSLPGLGTHFWRRAVRALAFAWLRPLSLGLLGIVVLEGPIGAPVTPGAGVLPLLCGVLTAAVSATFGLLFNASAELSALFSDDGGQPFWAWQTLSHWFGEPGLPFDIYLDAAPIPTLSWRSALELATAALLVFAGSLRRQEAAERPCVR